MAAIAYTVLQRTIIGAQGEDSKLAAEVGRDLKGKLSPLLYLLAIPLAFVQRVASTAIYASVALIWLIPDKRIESRSYDGAAACFVRSCTSFCSWILCASVASE